MQIDSEDINLNYYVVESNNIMTIYKKNKETEENQNWSDFILETEYEEGDYCYYKIKENDYNVYYDYDVYYNDYLVIELTEDYRDNIESNRIEVRTDY